MNSYYNKNGLFQAEYDELVENDFQFQIQEEKVLYKYHRFYNDGDLPNNSRFANTGDVELYFEQQANIVVARAYLRYNKYNTNKAINYFAKKQLVGFTTWLLKNTKGEMKK